MRLMGVSFNSPTGAFVSAERHPRHSSPCECDVPVQVDVVSTKRVLCVCAVGDVCVRHDRVDPSIHHVFTAIETFIHIFIYVRESGHLVSHLHYLY